MWFYDKDGNYAGGVGVHFRTQIEYYIGYCTQTEKTWTITYNYTERRPVYCCNGVQVLNVVLSASACSRKEMERLLGE